MLTNTQSVAYGSYAPPTALSVLTTGTLLDPAGEVFSLACDAVVTLVFVGTLYGVADESDTVVSVGLQIQNAALLGALAFNASLPPSALITDTSVVPITAELTVIMSPGTYAAYVNLIGSVAADVSITGVLSITSVKRFA